MRRITLALLPLSGAWLLMEFRPLQECGSARCEPLWTAVYDLALPLAVLLACVSIALVIDAVLELRVRSWPERDTRDSR